MRVLQVNTSDTGGGAARIAQELCQGCRAAGHEAWMAVSGRTQTITDAMRIQVHESETAWGRAWKRVGSTLAPFVHRSRAVDHLHYALTICAATPAKWLHRRSGHENFDFPASRRLLDLPPVQPDLVHCHNLHGEYFDLRMLPRLSHAVPTFLTLHDAWLLSGHCAHSFGCERWLSGCGKCPDLTITPAIQRDGTAYNWKRKRRIYSRSRLYVATPCNWLMRKVERSMLAEGIVDARVIPNGVDVAAFRPGCQSEARRALGVARDVRLLLFAASFARTNPFKDFKNLRLASEIVSVQRPSERLELVVLGDTGDDEVFGNLRIRFLPFRDDIDHMRQWYQAADAYVHPAKADTFPTVILEAMACGTPVVASAIDGICEQVRSFRHGSGSDAGHEAESATGFLVPPGDPSAIASAICKILNDEPLRRQLGTNGVADVRSRFALSRQVDEYLSWYEEVRASWRGGAAG
jgi:glycosyltransferase involved in cell wall biosynthesis